MIIHFKSWVGNY